jgi:hypothetical protein
MLTRRQRHALLLAVVIAGGALRFGAASYGLPRHDLGQDEMITALRARRGVLQGNPGWPVFHWPNLNIHLSRAAVDGVRWLERAAGQPPQDDVLLGRLYTAALGTLTLVALYLAGAKLFDPVVGIAAATFLAAIPLHAFRSRLWVPDVPMTFFYTLALLAAVWILARPTYARFVAAAAAIGMATATKYNGVGACLPVAVAAVLALPKIEGRFKAAAVSSRLALAGALSVAVFFAVDPYALPLFDHMLDGIGFIGGTYIDAPASGFLGWHIWSYVLGSYFAGGYEGVGPLISVLAAAGWAILLRRRDRPGTLVWLPAVLYLLIFSSFLHTPYERMYLPLAPHIALLAAVALVAGARRIAVWRRWPRPAPAIAAWVMVTVLWIAAVPAAEQAVAARRDETRVQAAAWLDANVPVGAIIMREWDMVWPSARHFGFNRRLRDIWEGEWTPQLLARHRDFVVVTSTNFARVQRQRRRPDFARRASYYDELFNGPLFELAARFEPDLHTFGPEVRIYRGLDSRKPTLGPARSELDLMRPRPWVSTPRLREEFELEGSFRFQSAGEVIGNDTQVRPGGWYRLEVTVDGHGPAPLEIGLGSERVSHRVEGRATVAVRALLAPGKNWWRAGAGAGFTETDVLTVRGLRLVRVPSGEGEPGSP